MWSWWVACPGCPLHGPVGFSRPTKTQSLGKGGHLKRMDYEKKDYVDIGCSIQDVTMGGCLCFSHRAFSWTSNQKCAVLSMLAQWREQPDNSSRSPVLPILLMPPTARGQLCLLLPRAQNSPVVPPARARKSWSCWHSWAGAPPKQRTVSTAAAAGTAPAVHRQMLLCLNWRGGLWVAALRTTRCSGRWDSRRRLMSPCPVFTRSSRQRTVAVPQE